MGTLRCNFDHVHCLLACLDARLNLSTLLTNPNISLERVGEYEIHPHPPVKVINLAGAARPCLRHFLGQILRRRGWDTQYIPAPPLVVAHHSSHLFSALLYS